MKRLLGIGMQGVLDAVYIRKNDGGAFSVRFYEYARDLAKPLEDRADVSLDGVWMETFDSYGRLSRRKESSSVSF